jgi:hypothetical protein
MFARPTRDQTLRSSENSTRDLTSLFDRRRDHQFDIKRIQVEKSLLRGGWHQRDSAR